MSDPSSKMSNKPPVETERAAQVYGLEVQIQSYKPFRDCRSIQDVFNVYDSIEGRALAAEERLADHPPSAPLPEGVQTRKE